MSWRAKRTVRVGYELAPGRITYWSAATFAKIRPARRWARRLNKRDLPGRWVVRV